MKRLVSFVLSAVVVIGVLVLFIVFARHSGPADSPRDTNNTKTVAKASALSIGGPGVFVRI
jgi:hypothetical protein